MQYHERRYQFPNPIIGGIRRDHELITVGRLEHTWRDPAYRTFVEYFRSDNNSSQALFDNERTIVSAGVAYRN